LFNEIEQAGNAEAYQFYLDEFPRGRHAPVARFRLYRAREQSARAPIAVPAAKTARQTKPKIAAPQTITRARKEAVHTSVLRPDAGTIVHAKAQITGVYKVPKVGRIAAVSVLSGSLGVGAHVRVLRGGQELYTGAITSLQIDRQYVAVAESGASCGLLLESFTEFGKGDILELAPHQPYALLEPGHAAFGRGKIIGRGALIGLFHAGGISQVAGCRIDTGRFVAGRPVRVVRSGDRNVHVDTIVSLKIHGSFVLKAEKGLECGIGLLSAYALRLGDTMECCES
jgi:translation initiation factor IF-2